ncbi:hypothetical protein ABPG74_019180 [Tetrahymena malaccensis]
MSACRDCLVFFCQRTIFACCVAICEDRYDREQKEFEKLRDQLIQDQLERNKNEEAQKNKEQEIESQKQYLDQPVQSSQAINSNENPITDDESIYKIDSSSQMILQNPQMVDQSLQSTIKKPEMK